MVDTTGGGVIVFPNVNLTSAGSEEFPDLAGELYFWEAVDSADELQLSAKVRCRVGKHSQEFPLRVGRSVIAPGSTTLRLAWDAQAGVYATFVLVTDPGIKLSGLPPAVLAVGDRPATASAAAVAVTSAAAVALAAANSSRKRLALFNMGGATVFIGGAGVTAAAGRPVPPDTGYESEFIGAMYGITAAGSADMRVLQETD